MRQFPATVEGQRDYIRAGGCGDAYAQAFRDFAAGDLARAAASDMELATALAFLYAKWSRGRPWEELYGSRKA